MAGTAKAKAPPIHALTIKGLFSGLSESEKLYAHHLARAAWHGTRIILRQVSPEAIHIFDFILELNSFCSGNWDSLAKNAEISPSDLEAFLDYAATFLSNVGNYYGSGDQKFVPDISSDVLARLGALAPRLAEIHKRISPAISTTPPYSLGFPGPTAQSQYYPGDGNLSREEISFVSRVLENNQIHPENTRIRKGPIGQDNIKTYDILVASSQVHDQRELRVSQSEEPCLGPTPAVRVVYGDHSEELEKICLELAEAAKFTTNELQERFLSQYIDSFRTGDLDIYRESQKTWVADKGPPVENIFGFVEPYRDPYGTRSEFEGLVAIADPKETQVLQRLVENSDKFIRRLPWATPDNDGKGPFEKTLFDPPDFSSIHALAYCSSIIFPGINLPNYNDIRQTHGFKNVIVANRMTAESASTEGSAFIDQAELTAFQKHKYAVYYWWVVLHELLGHGTGKLLARDSTSPNGFNFELDANGEPPLNPLTGRPIESWYEAGQTWTGQFGDLATTVDECRAELVGAYLMDDTELLALFGLGEGDGVSTEDVVYNMFMQLGTDGLRGLANFNVDTQTWGQAHSRAHFAILKNLLQIGNGVLRIDYSSPSSPSSSAAGADADGDGRLVVRVDREKLRASEGKRALGEMLLRLHMYRCTADVAACREYYGGLSLVEAEHLAWREVVMRRRGPRWVFVQANTFLKTDAAKGTQSVVLREYEPTARGVIQSWAERDV